MQPQQHNSNRSFSSGPVRKAVLVAGMLALALLVLPWLNLPYGSLNWVAHGQPYEPPEPPPAPPEDPTVRLFADYGQRDLRYEFDGQRVYAGPEGLAPAILYFDGRHIFRGSDNTGQRLFTIVEAGPQEWRLFAGANVTGPLVYTIEGNRIRAGNAKGEIIYFVRRDDLLAGPNKLGPLVLHGNRDLRHPPILLLLAPLADGRW